MSDIERRVRKVVSEKFQVPDYQLPPNAAFVEDLGADSLDAVELIMLLEDEFQVEIPDEEVGHLLTLRDTVRYLSLAETSYEATAIPAA